MNTQCAAVYRSITTKMAPVKQVTDEITTRLTGSCANLRHFKTRQVPVTHNLRDNAKGHPRTDCPLHIFCK